MGNKTTILRFMRSKEGVKKVRKCSND